MSDPTIVDVVRATDGSADDLLSAILKHQEAEREHWQDIQDSWLAQAKARAAYLEHGIAQLISETEYGGTTAQYEYTLKRINNLILFKGYVAHQYIAAFKEDPFCTTNFWAQSGGGYGSH